MVSGKAGTVKSRRYFWQFGGNWRFGVPFWRPLDLTGVPKSTIFGKIRKTNEKNEVQETGWKKHDFYLFLMPKWEAWNGKKKFSHYTCCKIWLFWSCEIYRKKSKDWPETTTSITLGASGRICEISGRFRERWFFDFFLIGQKLVPKIRKKTEKHIRGDFYWHKPLTKTRPSKT